jgi:hypothetical protein
VNEADVVLSATQIMAAASSLLLHNGYRQSAASLGDQWNVESARLFEDPYSVAALVVFPTWAELKENWTSAQADLVGAMSHSISSADPKVWEGYLILLTPSTPGADRGILDTIRRDTSRVRKLVATGDELRHLMDVERILDPLLPLEVDGTELMVPEDPLESLASLPALRDISPEAVQDVVDAFRHQQPIIERLHRPGRSQ